MAKLKWEIILSVLSWVDDLLLEEYNLFLWNNGFENRVFYNSFPLCSALPVASLQSRACLWTVDPNPSKWYWCRLVMEHLGWHATDPGILWNQLEKLEAAKAACLVWLSLLSLTGSFLVFLGPSGSIFTDLTRPYLALLGLTYPYWALLSFT